MTGVINGRHQTDHSVRISWRYVSAGRCGSVECPWRGYGSRWQAQSVSNVCSPEAVSLGSGAFRHPGSRTHPATGEARTGSRSCRLGSPIGHRPHLDPSMPKHLRLPPGETHPLPSWTRIRGCGPNRLALCRFAPPQHLTPPLGHVAPLSGKVQQVLLRLWVSYHSSSRLQLPCPRLIFFCLGRHVVFQTGVP